MLLYNCTNEPQTVKALGNWFSFKPHQVKSVQDNIGRFIATERQINGIMSLPEEFEDPEYKTTEEGKAKLAAIEEAGLKAYLGHLRSVIYNNQVSLRQDLEKANIKADPAVFASEGELEAMRLLAKYQSREEDAAQKKADEVKELMKQVGPINK